MSNSRQTYLKGTFFMLVFFASYIGYGQINLFDGQSQLSMTEGCQIECNPVPDTIYCNEGFENVPIPSVASCSQIYSIQMVNEVYVDDNFCDDNMKKVERLWKALDESGNELSSCVQTIVINKIDVDLPKDIVWTYEQYNFSPLIIDATPVHESIFDLDVYDGENDIDTDPGLSEFVVQNTGSGFPKGTEDASCLYDVTYQDSIVLGCKQSFQVFRSWHVVEQCSGVTIIHEQKISVNDKSTNVNLENSPEYVLNGAHYEYHVNANNNLCKSTDFILAPHFFEGVDTTSVVITTPLGELVNATAEGGFIPSPGLNVGTYTDGLKIQVTDFCGNTEIILVTLVVDASNNPTCNAPQNVSVSCVDFSPNLSNYGLLDTSSGCGADIDSTNSFVDWVAYDTICHTGVITRYWSVWDINGNTGSCLQKITVVPPLTYAIRFPDDVMDGSIDTIAPTFLGNCGPTSWDVYDVKVIPQGQCLGKLYRTYTTHNTCDFDANYQPEMVDNPESSTGGAIGNATPQNHGVLSYTLVIDNFCDTRTVSGRIELKNGVGISNVIVSAKSSDLSKPIFSTVTDQMGNYSLSLPVQSDYIIKPEKLDDTYKNGVDIGDAKILYKHILVIPQITSPYKILAANVLAENSAKVKELLELQKLVLNKIDGFEKVPVWTFAESTVDFPKPLQPYVVHYSTSLVKKLQDNQVIDFYGIKYGDLDDSALMSANSTIYARSEDVTQLSINDIYMEEGKEYEVPFSLLSEKEILSYQFTLDFDTDYLDFKELIVDAHRIDDDFNLSNLKNGLLATAQVGNVNQDKPIFSIKFKAKQSGYLSQVLSITDEITPSKAFDEGFGAMQLRLKYHTADSHPSLTLFQNTPNPFSEMTTIKFELQKEEKLSLIIYSADGHVVCRREKLYPSGLHQEIFNEDLFTENGIYYYRVQTANQVYMKKMIKF